MNDSILYGGDGVWEQEHAQLAATYGDETAAIMLEDAGGFTRPTHPHTPGPAAMDNLKAGGSKWGAAKTRLECDVTVPNLTPSFKLTTGSSVFAIGSCFARNIEEALEDYHLDIRSLRLRAPYKVRAQRCVGIINKYNPVTILHELEWALQGKPVPEALYMDAGDGRVIDPNLKRNETPQPLDVAVAFREHVANYFRWVTGADLVIITLGMVECWKDMETGVVLNQMPHPRRVRREPGRYVFVRLGVPEVYATLERCLGLLHSAGVRHVVLSVSPVPLTRTFTGQDIIAANCYSKSALRVAAESIAERHSWCDYWPSYEAIVYGNPAQVYEADRSHVKDAAVRQVMAKFVERYIAK